MENMNDVYWKRGRASSYKIHFFFFILCLCPRLSLSGSYNLANGETVYKEFTMRTFNVPAAL